MPLEPAHSLLLMIVPLGSLQGSLTVVVATGQATLVFGSCTGTFRVSPQADTSLFYIGLASGRLVPACTHHSSSEGQSMLSMAGADTTAQMVISNTPPPPLSPGPPIHSLAAHFARED